MLKGMRQNRQFFAETARETQRAKRGPLKETTKRTYEVRENKGFFNST
jgi:hypothetical protein